MKERERERDRIRKRTIRLVRQSHGEHQLVVPTPTPMWWAPHVPPNLLLFSLLLYFSTPLPNQTLQSLMSLKLTNLPLLAYDQQQSIMALKLSIIYYLFIFTFFFLFISSNHPNNHFSFVSFRLHLFFKSNKKS